MQESYTVKKTKKQHGYFIALFRHALFDSQRAEFHFNIRVIGKIRKYGLMN